MIIIKPKITIPKRDLDYLYGTLCEMALKNGIIMVPNGFEVYVDGNHIKTEGGTIIIGEDSHEQANSKEEK